MPSEVYPQVFSEVFRVLKPGGFLYVIEPVDCPSNQVMMLYNNEERERALAQEVLQEVAKPAFETCKYVRYHGVTKYESFEHYAEHYSCLLYTSPSPRDATLSRMPSSA